MTSSTWPYLEHRTSMPNAHTHPHTPSGGQIALILHTQVYTATCTDLFLSLGVCGCVAVHEAEEIPTDG